MAIDDGKVPYKLNLDDSIRWRELPDAQSLNLQVIDFGVVQTPTVTGAGTSLPARTELPAQTVNNPSSTNTAELVIYASCYNNLRKTSTDIAASNQSAGAYINNTFVAQGCTVANAVDQNISLVASGLSYSPVKFTIPAGGSVDITLGVQHISPGNIYDVVTWNGRAKAVGVLTTI